MKVRADRIISTASDSGAIISAYSRILTTFGGTIYLAEGTYNCSTNAIIYSNVTLSGNGIGTVLKRMALSGAMSGVVSTLNSSSNIRLKNFKVDGNNGTYTGAGIILGTTCSYVTISDITCIDNTTSGIHLSTSTFVTIKDCILAGDNYVIDASISTDARIMNNSILTGSASAAVVIGAKSIVKGNQITSGASYSIRSVAATPRSIISDNHITCATRTGVYLYESSDYCIVSNNLIDCAGSGTGIQLLKSDLCVVSGNVIIDPSTGISITGDGGSGCISCTVIGNTIYSASTIGITISAASCQYNVLIGNATDEGANNSITNSGTGTLCGIITGAVVNLAGAYINH
jgi:parallel beta-helix repeat protein